jgi:hypothetical protein
MGGMMAGDMASPAKRALVSLPLGADHGATYAQHAAMYQQHVTSSECSSLYGNGVTTSMQGSYTAAQCDIFITFVYTLD